METREELMSESTGTVVQSKTQRYFATKSDYKERINIGLVSRLSPEGVFAWLKDSYQEPTDGIYMDMKRKPEEQPILEYCLYRRNDPLIDYAVARYGSSSKVLKRVYRRADVGTRLATIANPNGSMLLELNDAFFQAASDTELQAFFSNKYLVGGFFTNIFERKHGFSALSDDNLLRLINFASGHPRLSSGYTSLYMDGMDEYEYGLTFTAAWGLAKTAPLTIEWACALDGLLSKCKADKFIKDAAELIARWRIPEDFNEGDPWYKRGPFFEIRSTLAKLLIDEELVNSDDPALRIGFYRRFDPKRFPDWKAYFDKDGEEFVNAAMLNENIWKSDEYRSVFSSLCWKCPDPQSTMDMPNNYRAREKYFQDMHPEWFLEAKEDSFEEEKMNPTLQVLEGMKNQLNTVANALVVYTSKVPSGAGWWVVAALLSYHIFFH